MQKKIQVEKDLALIEGSDAKEFLEDDEDRAFGGTSKVDIDYTFQTMQVKKEHCILSKEPKILNNDSDPFMHPKCELLEDGSGYELFNVEGAQFYNEKTLSSITENKIIFE